MSKFLKISINIILLIIFSYVLKFISLYYFMVSDYPVTFRELYTAMFRKNYKQVYDNYYYRPAENENAQGNPILILGCSFAHGVSIKSLKDNETFSYRLGEILKKKRPVINRAMGSQGLQAMIYQIHDMEIIKDGKKPEYIIYVFIEDQVRRLYMECLPYNKSAFYRKTKDNGLKLITSKIYYSYPLIVFRYYYYGKRFDRISYEDKFEFLKLHFLKLKEEADKKWGNVEKIILYYDYCEQPMNINELEEYGFKIIKVSELVPGGFFNDVKYKVSANDDHPTKYAWEVITPAFYKKMVELYNFD